MAIVNKTYTVFDCDDVLLDLTQFVTDTLGLPVMTEFSYRESGQYNAQDTQAITDAYSSANVFYQVPFYEGADKIMQLEEYGTEVHICTRSFTDAVTEVKKQRLPGHTKVPLAHIDFQRGYGEGKKFPEYTDIAIDDCIDNLTGLPPDYCQDPEAAPHEPAVQ